MLPAGEKQVDAVEAETEMPNDDNTIVNDEEDDFDLEADEGVAAPAPASAAAAGHADRPTEAEVLRIRELLGRLQKQAHKNPKNSVTLKQDDLTLLAELMGRGLIRAPSTIESSMGPIDREMTAVQYSTVESQARGGEHWPVHVGFKNVNYVVSVPKEDVGIATVASTMYKMIQPLVKVVRCGASDRVDLPILRNVSGAFEAGVSTLVLGPPGCGVSTLFRVLSGRIATGKHAKVTGDMYYSGYTPEELHLRKLSGLIDQVDEHTPVLTVRETLQFAYDCYGGAEMAERLIAADKASETATQEEIDMIREQLIKFPDFVIENMALSNAANTVVGNDMLRGVSGGEKKRVTSSEMMMGRRPLTFYDQISTGLDSAATYDICRRIAGVSKNLEMTPVVALLQPPPEVYDLFDEILIMALGFIVYHGPRENVLPYFSSIGFDCPHDRDIADFIQEVTTPARTRYQTRSDAPDSEKAMAAAWLASPYSEKKRQQTDERCDPNNKVDAITRRELFAKETPVFANSWWKDLCLVMKRQNQLVYRDPAFIKARIAQAVIMGTVMGTVFIRISPELPSDSSATDLTPITQRYGIIFATLMQCGLAGMAQVPVVLDQRPVYYKQSQSHFFRTINYVIAETVTVLPISFIESVILSAFVFWISALVPWGEDSQTGETDIGSAFILFVIVMLCLNTSFAAYLRAIASLAPSTSIGQVCAGLSIAATVLFSGYIITADVMPPWFIWIYWLSPISWAFRSGVLIIFKSSAFTEEQQNYALDLFSFSHNDDYLWGGILLLIGYMVLDAVISYLGYSYVRYESPGSRQTKVSPDAEDTHNPDVAEVERLMAGTSASSSALIADGRTASKLEQAASSGQPEVQVRVRTSLQDDSFTPVDLVFRDLWYSVQAPGEKSGYNLDLLKGISGFAEAGTLTALMGSSGAGKSTLLDVLALRKTGGKITGDVLVNGRPQEKITFSRIVGYVEQNDIHSPAATVEEALTFSAVLRQPSEVSREAKAKFVEEVLSTLELDDIRGFQIGYKSEGGLSVEQAKRLTIGVELAANPAIIFADEPTSGLDANSARVVMDCLERIARAGRTVVCTIHQPSKDIFTKFDRLLLLRRGGETVYFGDLGENSQILLDYLSAIPGTPGMPNPRYNPATYMLEAIGGNAGKSLVDYAHEYRESAVRKENEAKIEELVKSNLEERPEIHFDRRFASNFKDQMEMLFLRWLRAYWRNPSYNTTRFVVAVFIALFFGFTFFQQGEEISTSQDVQSFVGLMFMSSTFTGVISLNTAIPTIIDERSPFYRERAASYYSVSPMVIAITSMEVPYTLLASFVYVPVFYFIVHLWYNVNGFFAFWGIYVLLQLTLTFLGHLFATVAPNEQVAAVMGALCFGFWNITAGLMIAVRDVPYFWQWMTYINPIRYALNALVVAQLSCADGVPQSSPGCSELSNYEGNAWDYIQSTFGYEANDLAFCLGALAGFCAGFRILTALAYTYVSFLKR
ncbi:ABC transporter G family member 31 [Hondaea fermentalgiana]|uniref:ABC transporter G family member 31 n=1 Tax=Hondaea fermentalgiana TaxID=2315210 RepID=A0A2R5GSV1_9STRA|nr:ABC transporter G family member 31 [Hondaea fermentalgiana]|eukprot:GBG33920.1 ABC transporter G family member 31 [Hondaea fermentalgiana]